VRALERNRPYDYFVESLVAPNNSSDGFIRGIVWRGETAMVMRPAMQAAQNVSQVFLGVNLKCASCHDSFVDHWSLSDAYSLANCFSEEPLPLVRCDVPTGDMADYAFLWEELGGVDGAQPLEERRERVAELVTSEANGPFTRTIVNRIWARCFGYGLVEPIDNIEAEAWSPELLDWLAQDLIAHDYDLKHLMRRMLTSRAYRSASRPLPDGNAKHADYVFRGPHLRRVTAEQYYDSLSQITGVWQSGPRFLFQEDRTLLSEAKAAAREAGEDEEQVQPDYPKVRAWRVPSDTLTTALGRTNREQVTTRRLTESTTLQTMELTNGATLAAFLERGSKAIDLGESDAASAAADLLERALLREPTADEIAIAADLLGDPVTPEGIADLLWAIAMLPEFTLIY